MIALFLKSILNTFLSGRVRPIYGKFDIRLATFEPRPKKTIIACILVVVRSLCCFGVGSGDVRYASIETIRLVSYCSSHFGSWVSPRRTLVRFLVFRWHVIYILFQFGFACGGISGVYIAQTYNVSNYLSKLLPYRLKNGRREYVGLIFSRSKFQFTRQWFWYCISTT